MSPFFWNSAKVKQPAFFWASGNNVSTQLNERQRTIQASNEHAYTLEEVAEMLDKLPEPAAPFALLLPSQVLPVANYAG